MSLACSKSVTIRTHPLLATGLLVFGRVSGPAGNRFFWMAFGLCTEILTNRLQGAWAYRLERITLRPAQSVRFVAETFNVCLVRAASLEALHQAAQGRLGVGPSEHMKVCRHDPHFEHVSAFLASDAPEIVTEEGC